MNPLPFRWIVFALVAIVLAGSTETASAGRSGSSGFRRYAQQQLKAQQQAMQFQQKYMQELAARQAALQQHKQEMLQKASKARHDKEEQHRQEMIAKRKAEQAAKEKETAAKPPADGGSTK